MNPLVPCSPNANSLFFARSICGMLRGAAAATSSRAFFGSFFLRFQNRSVGVALKSTRFASRISTPGRASPDPPSGGDLFIFERAKRCLLVALRKISLQCNDLSLSEAKQTLASGFPGKFMSSRPSELLFRAFCHPTAEVHHCSRLQVLNRSSQCPSRHTGLGHDVVLLRCGECCVTEQVLDAPDIDGITTRQNVAAASRHR